MNKSENLIKIILEGKDLNFEESKSIFLDSNSDCFSLTLNGHIIEIIMINEISSILFGL